MLRLRGCANVFGKAFEDKDLFAELSVLYLTEGDIPNDAIAVRPDLDEELVGTIKETFLQMKDDAEGADAMSMWGHLGHTEADESVYDTIEEYTEKASRIAMIEFKDVSKVYANGTRGLDHRPRDSRWRVRLDHRPVGAGKSSPLRSINRLVDVTEGEVVVDCESVTCARQARPSPHPPAHRHGVAGIQPGQAQHRAAQRALGPPGLLLDLAKRPRALFA